VSETLEAMTELILVMLSLFWLELTHKVTFNFFPVEASLQSS
jgi:hypothetical protein